MSLYDFAHAIELVKADEPFYAFIMAAMIKADTPNLVRLRMAWPEVWLELDSRYHAPGGRIEGDE